MIFTFGFGHECSCGLSLRNCYVELDGDYETARARMAELYGRKWAFQYDDALAAGVERWALTRVAPNEVCACGGLGREPWSPNSSEVGDGQ
jgi:hypothetical protein